MLRRTALLLVAAATLALVVGCGDDGNGDDDPESTALTVVDYNILHGITNEDEAAEPFDRMPERIEIIADSLAEARPDIVTLQEVFLNTADGYPEVVQSILDALGPDYQSYFGSITGADVNVGTDLGQVTITRLPVVSSENFTAGGLRTVLRVTVQTEGGPVDVYNAHLEGTGAVTDAGEDEALIEIENVLGFIEATRSGTGPVVFGGDLNATPDESSIVKLVDDGWIDALATGGDATCGRTGDPGCTSGNIPLADPAPKADHRIDYIWALPGTEYSIEVKEARLFNNEPFDIGEGAMLWASDHIGVRAVLEIRSTVE
jgi:endonuclease/exonuclease/phosphatase family metal-dependent hydrolase